MTLHGVTQLASNAWRAPLWWRHIRWRPVAAYVTGCMLALLAWSMIRYVPDTPVALLMLGITSFMSRRAPKSLRATYGVICMTLTILTEAASIDPVVAVLAIVASMIGTGLAARVLEAMSDMHFHLWANRIITAIASYYIIDGAYLLIWSIALQEALRCPTPPIRWCSIWSNGSPSSRGLMPTCSTAGAHHARG